MSSSSGMNATSPFMMIARRLYDEEQLLSNSATISAVIVLMIMVQTISTLF
ncbi:hypothetical protein [Sphingorhabdus sp.]|uniref:hypothetical protein n=1 Tax=Sphingorhabdus sp. TaxID=1902408 RepID=UPI0035941687